MVYATSLLFVSYLYHFLSFVMLNIVFIICKTSNNKVRSSSALPWNPELYLTHETRHYSYCQYEILQKLKVYSRHIPSASNWHWRHFCIFQLGILQCYTCTHPPEHIAHQQQGDHCRQDHLFSDCHHHCHPSKDSLNLRD